MLEIRIHGRGGQGNVAAAYLLAGAAFETGRHAQAFPNFGAERRGAPVVAFVRIADAPIRRRCQVLTPDWLIVQDDALLTAGGVGAGLKAGGRILVNSTHSPQELLERSGLETTVLAADSLSKQFLGRPMPNTALLSALLTLTGLLPRDALIKALGQRFKGELLEKNTQLIDEAARQVPEGAWS